MTTTEWLRALVPLVADLPQDLEEAERYRRLLQALRSLFPCDAVALLKLDGDTLVPLAVDGLSRDVLGRRFRVAEHPRLAVLLQGEAPQRFEPGSPLPDPYDGLLESPAPEALDVHDCMGCALVVEGQPWGVLTLDALQAGCFDERHLEMLDAFGKMAAATVAAATRMNRLALQARWEHTRAESYRRAWGQPERKLLGHSAAARALQRDIDLVAASDLTVLITGETGVGKELVAQALHARSARADRPLVSLNCAALPDTLVESELFGHVRGAFTGAVSERQGKFELADGGTLFLDEVAEMPLPVQAKLLRVLQSGQLQRLGSDREHRVDVRLIAATNRDLAAEVRAGRLRADIYHRLSAFPLRVPPLRERGRDVLVLAGHFLEENRSRLGLGGLRLDPGAQAALLHHDWPGNVRELEHLIGRSVLRALGRNEPRPRILTLAAADLQLPPAEPAGQAAQPAPAPEASPGQGLRESVEDLQRRMVQDALARHGGNWAAAARSLQLDRANLARLARRLGLP
ncbi:nitric oxide reductase transcriptional regulator NorR [Ramlibacter rhizophilus]|uniref:Nitric oxide reductase transcriptional regulator NorR n=1 Tax=Ramlibacter rhizophilus TaxID=1781167 RepID=A0A4Z0BKJ6_9BURK|nr:nitric oxide reductase transcriptional regulator NorR [Ramlibacter rhizophilus]TFY99836.1 nitric oxide reductase transcriptional regulator NorR [Ramlibacter rhizophilus]